jgi:hypothetical protein
MKYTTLTTVQLLIMTLLTGLIAGALSVGAGIYHEFMLLPTVYRAGTECVKVVNYQNGHAFTCPDVDVLLRRYRIGVSQ